MKTGLALLGFLGVFLLSGTLWAQDSSVAATKADKLVVSWEWAEENRGPNGPSPEIRVGQIPAETVKLSVSLRDIDRPQFNHGGGSVKIEQGLGEFVIPGRALKVSYKGPYPPRNEIHNYQFTVKALDEKKNVLADGSAERTFKGK